MNEKLRAIAYSMDCAIPGIYFWGFGRTIRIGGALPDDRLFRYPGRIPTRLGAAIVFPGYRMISTCIETHDPQTLGRLLMKYNPADLDLPTLVETNRRLNRRCQSLESALNRASGLDAVVAELKNEATVLRKIRKDEFNEWRQSRNSCHEMYRQYIIQLPANPYSRYDGVTSRLEYAVKIINRLPCWLIRILGA